MEADNKVEDEHEDMDFESGIDSWRIDKEDSSNSCSSSLWFREASKVSSEEVNIMNKENEKQKSSCETENNSLRNIRKTNRTADKEYFVGFDCEINSSSPTDETSITSFTSGTANRYKDKESLSSEEISIMLKEIDGSSESESEKRRSRLQSIENVASPDGNETDRNLSTLSLDLCCAFCKTSFQSLDELKFHERKHRNQSNQDLAVHQKALTECKSVFENPNLFDSVKSWTTNEKNKLDNLVTLRNNITDASLLTNPKGLRCKHCSHYSTDPLAYKTHQILVHSERNRLLDCDYCDYHTTVCSNLARHIAVHFQLNCPYPECDYKYTSKELFDSHLLMSHGPEKTFKCKKCDYTCRTHKKLKRHAQKHFLSSKYTCGDCGLKFGNRETFGIHLKTHELGTTQFKCKDCNKMFAEKHLFKQHKKGHSQVFMCDTCNNKFTKKHSLTVHMKIHTVESFKCGKCNQIFHKKNYLRLHMRSHQPKQSCKHCPFQTNSSKRFSKHACINKLYDIQERTLDFLKEDEISEVKQSSIQEASVHSKNRLNGTTNKHTKIPKNVRKTKSRVRKVNTKAEVLDINSKLRSLRPNLPSRRSHESIKSTVNNELISCESKSLDYRSGHSTVVMSKLSIRKARQNGALLSKKGSLVNKKPTKTKKKQKNDLITFGSDEAKWVLGKTFIRKDLLTEPYVATNSSFVQCFYQSQSLAAPDHIALHLRQTPLLSCRFCNYKTNSTYLLKQHSTNVHAWNSNLVNTLFQ